MFAPSICKKEIDEFCKMREEERKKALLDVICRLKENSIAHRTAQLAPTDMKGLMELMESKKKLEDLKAGRQYLHISLN